MALRERQIFLKLPLFFLILFFINSCISNRKVLNKNPFEEIEVAIEKNNFREASILIDKKLKRNDQDSYLLFLKGTLKLKEKKYAEAEKLLKESIKINPKNPAALFNLGNLSLELKDYHKCLEIFQKFIRENKENQFYNDALKGVNFCFDKILEEKDVDKSGILPSEKRGSILLYRKLEKRNGFDEKIRFYLAREIFIFTSQVSIIFKNNTGEKISYDFKNISISSGNKKISYDPSRYIPGADNIKIEGGLEDKKYAYLIIACPELDLTKPVKIEFKSFLNENFEIIF